MREEIWRRQDLFEIIQSAAVLDFRLEISMIFLFCSKPSPLLLADSVGASNALALAVESYPQPEKPLRRIIFGAASQFYRSSR